MLLKKIFYVYNSLHFVCFVLFWDDEYVAFLVKVPSLCLSLPFRNLCWAWLIDRYCLNVFLSWNILVSPSMLNESFAGCSSLGGHLCSLRVWMTSDQALLAFIVSIEKSGVILIGLILYVTWHFFHVAFNILSLLCALSILIIIWWEDFLFWSHLFGVLWAFCTFIAISFFMLGKFSSMILLKTFSGPLSW